MEPALKIAILSGPTASGKTAIALEFARSHPEVEIVNADSMLFYRGADIGSAKPTPEERAEIPHHLIDIADPNEPFTAGDFKREAEKIFGEIHARGRRALVVGGSGFYLKALLYGLWVSPKADPELRAELEKVASPELYRRLFQLDEKSALRIGVNDRYRLVRALEVHAQSGKTPSEMRAEEPSAADPRFELFVIDRETTELEARIHARTEALLAGGLIEETKRLASEFPESRCLLSVGYAQTLAYLRGMAPAGRRPRPDLAGLAQEIELATRQLVKRQRTWFRGEKSAKPFQLERDRPGLIAILSKIYPLQGPPERSGVEDPP